MKVFVPFTANVSSLACLFWTLKNRDRGQDIYVVFLDSLCQRPEVAYKRTKDFMYNLRTKNFKPLFKLHSKEPKLIPNIIREKENKSLFDVCHKVAEKGDELILLNHRTLQSNVLKITNISINCVVDFVIREIKDTEFQHHLNDDYGLFDHDFCKDTYNQNYVFEDQPNIYDSLVVCPKDEKEFTTSNEMNGVSLLQGCCDSLKCLPCQYFLKKYEEEYGLDQEYDTSIILQ